MVGDLIRRSSSLELLQEVSDMIPARATQVLVHSSLINFGMPSDGVEVFRDLLVDTLVFKRNLRLIIPTFTFSLEKPWRQSTYTSHCGSLGKAFIQKYSQCRSIHPVHSTIVIDQQLSRGGSHVTSYGPGSIWPDFVNDSNSVNLGLGLNMDGGATFMHAIEQFEALPYRQTVDLSHVVIHNGIPITGFQYFSRPPGLEINDWEPVEEHLVVEGLFERMSDNCPISRCYPREIYEYLQRCFEINPNFFYDTTL